MDKLKALFEAVRAGGGEFPDTFLDDASAAYDEDMGIANGKVEALALENEALTAEVLALKSANYDLIMAGRPEPGSDGEGSDGGESEDSGEDDSDESEEEDTETIDDLFNEH